MVMIPQGNFGQRVARGPSFAAIEPGAELGNAATRLAGTAVNVQADMVQAETQRRAHELAQAQHEAKEAAAAALKAKTFTALTSARDSLTDLHDEITAGVVDGSVPKDKAVATWAERAGKALDGVGADLPESSRALMRAELDGTAARMGNSVRKAVTLRDRQDVTAGISQTLEYLQRQYKGDPALATQQAMGLIDQLGPHSTLNAEQLAKLRQGWKEGTQYTAGYELVSAGRNDRKALDAAEKAIGSGLPDLDPQKRATLLDRVASYRFQLDQRAELAAQRAQREAERRMRQAEAAFNTFQGLADKGTVLAPEYIDQALQLTAGTPYQGGIKALAEAARDSGGLAAQPLAVQQATLQAVDAQIAQQGRTPELDKRRTQIEKVLRGSQEDLQRDPLRAGLERGVVTELQPIDPAGGLPGLLQQLQQRAPLAQRVQAWAGRPVSPMTADEAARLKAQMDTLPAKERSGFVAAIAQAVGPQQAQGLAAQMDKHDKALGLAFAAGADATTAGRYTSELILKGQAAKADGTSTKGQKQPELKAGAWRAHAAAALDGVFQNAQFSSQVAQAAELIMHGMAAEAGGELSARDMDRAVRLAIAGDIVERNGQKVPVPAGVDADALDKRLESVSVDELRGQAPEGSVLAGGVPLPLADFVKTLPGQQLMAVGRGRYAVLVGGRPVVNGQGKVVVIGVR